MLLNFIALLLIFFTWARLPILMNQSTINLVVSPNHSFRQITKQINHQGFALNVYFFEILARVLAKSNIVKAGSYTVLQGTSPYNLLHYITSGKVNYSSIKIIEGWTFAKMKESINMHPDLLHDTCSLNEAALLQYLGSSYTNPEGLFFPDTYFFPKNSSDLVVYSAAYRAMEKKLDILWRERDPKIFLKSKYDGLILASLIEKETSLPADRGRVAGVFMNRLKVGMPLQTDPAVMYGLMLKQNFKQKQLLTRNSLRIYTPYNTYQIAGLPPTPIALPGLEAIRAALHPSETASFYFVARGNGYSYFSQTLGEHNQAVNKFIKKSKSDIID